jgi:radical SAM protein with 4Fe4S-binding SPASM domain
MNGYGLEQSQYDILLEKFYGFEEYYYYKRDEYYKDYIFILRELDKIYSQGTNSPYTDAITGWYLFFKNSERYIRSYHACFRVTDACQLHCKHCYNQHLKRENRFMLYDEFVYLFYRLHDVAQCFIHYKNIPDRDYDLEGGEATLNPDLPKMIHFLNQRGVGVAIPTNGIYLTDVLLYVLSQRSSLDKVQLSIDGFEESHDFLRGDGSYRKTISNIQRLKEIGVEVTANMVLHEGNYDEYIPLRKYLWNEYKIILGRMLYTSQNVPSLSPINADRLRCFSEERRLRGDISCHDGYPCNIGHQSLIRENGDFAFCGKGFDTSVTNFFDNSIEEATQMIKMFTLKHRSVPKYCFDCRRVSFCQGGALCSRYKEGSSLNIEDRSCHILGWKEQGNLLENLGK